MKDWGWRFGHGKLWLEGKCRKGGSAERVLLGQALCFLAGANSIFTGDKLLTTANNEMSEDDTMFELLGLKGRPAFLPYAAGAASSDGSEEAPRQQRSSSA